MPVGTFGYRVLARSEHRGIRQVGAVHTMWVEEYEYVPDFWHLFNEDLSVSSLPEAQTVQTYYKRIYPGEEFDIIWTAGVVAMDITSAFEAAAQEAAKVGLSFEFQGFDVTLDDTYESLLPRMPRQLNAVGLLDTVDEPVLAEAANAWKSVEDEWDHPLVGEPLVWAVWHVPVSEAP